MSGLALVAQSLGAEVSGSDRAESSYSQRLRAHGIEPAIGHDAANVPEGAELVVSTAIPESNPELAAARAAGVARAPPGRAAGRGLAAEALDRRVGHPWQDHDQRDGRPRAVGLRPRAGVRDRGRAALGRHQRGVGGGRMDRGGGRRVRPLVPAARPRRGGDHQRGARPPRHLPLAVGAAAGVRAVRRAGRHRDRRSRRPVRGRHRLWDRHGRPERRERCAAAARLHLRGGGPAGGARRARRAQRAQRAGGAGGLPRGGRRAGARRRPRWPATRARAGGSRTGGARPPEPGCSTTTPTTRPRCAPPWRPPARWAPSAWWRAFSRTSIRAPASWRANSAAHWRWPTSWWCATSTPPASGRRTSPA